MSFNVPKPLHGWREFAGEVGIIVLGVLIALAAGQAVENFHSGEKARVAANAMRIELSEDDGPQAYARVAIGSCFDHQLAELHDAASAGPPPELRQWAASYVPPFRTWDSEAWKFVVSSDVGSFMGAENLVGWSAAYRVLPGLNDTNVRETELATELREALPPSGEISPGDRQNLRRLAGLLRVLNERIERGSQLFLGRISELNAGVSVQTQRSLIAHARALYGTCVVVPNVESAGLAQRQVANLRGFAH